MEKNGVDHNTFPLEMLVELFEDTVHKSLEAGQGV